MENKEKCRFSRGTQLPLSPPPRAIGGSLASALSLLLLTLPAQADESALQQAEGMVGARMAQLLEQHAQQQGWRGMEYRLQHEALGTPPAAPCPAPLTLESLGAEPSPLKRQRFLLRCAELGWQLSLLSQAEVFLPVVLAARVLERDQTIGEADLKLEKINLAKAQRGFFNRLDAVAGQSAKRRIRADQILHPGLLDAPLLVRRGDKVKILARKDGIQASTNGEALSNGKQGEVIRVRNLSSDKLIDAKVMEPGVVTSTYD